MQASKSLHHPYAIRLGKFIPFFLVFLLSSILSSCNYPPPISSSDTQDTIMVVTPLAAETSVFTPVIPPTAANPVLEVELPQEPLPTPGLQPGLQYNPLEPGTPVTISKFKLVADQKGWAEWQGPDFGLSGFLLRTDNGVSSWVEVTPPSGYPIGSRFFALDERIVWVVPSLVLPGKEVEAGYTWRSTDAGLSWEPSNSLLLELEGEPTLLENFIPHAVFFLDEQTGWLAVSVGHYMNQDVLVIYGTQDGGLTWDKLVDKFSMGSGGDQDGLAGMPCRVTGLTFVDSQHGYLAGDCLAVSMDEGWSILETNDGGRTWSKTILPEPSGVPQNILDSEHMCAPTWVERNPAGILVQHTCLVAEDNRNLAEYHFLSLSSDQGETWIGWPGETASFINPNTGYSLGSLLEDQTRSLSVTQDGGITWQQVRQVSWQYASLEFISAEAGYALAWRWNPERQNFDYALVYTSDGGGSWELIESKVK